MKRRRFLTAAAATPAVPALLAQSPAGAPGGRPLEEIKIPATPAEVAADPAPRFFSPRQMAVLRKLADTLMPPASGEPGAVQCGAPEFLDFLLAESPGPRQYLYRTGLDTLDIEAKKRHKKPFAELDAAAIDAILKPLLVPWTYDPPKDPTHRFLAEVRADVRTATQNSREYAAASNSSGRRGRRGGGRLSAGLYWKPIDPRRG